MLIACCTNNVPGHPDDIAPTVRKAFDTPGPVLIGVCAWTSETTSSSSKTSTSEPSCNCSNG
jgi:hypothetical protein